MEAMKRLLFLLCGSAVLACGADLSDIRTVYLMPMARGMDQYLAHRLTGEKVFQVVTDPKEADAIFSDRIGEAFRAQVERLLPPAKPAPEKAPPEKTASDKPAPAKPAKDEEEAPAKLITETENKLDNPALNSSFGRGKGTIFLVDLKTSKVLWSAYEEPLGNDGKTLDRAALDVVNRLKKDLAPPKPKK
jgi:hypothetical protein